MTTNTNMFFPGQLLRVTHMFEAWDDNLEDSHQVKPGTIIMLLFQYDRMFSRQTLCATTFLTSNGTVLEADWFNHPFVDYYPVVEPVT
jgi:hypothetical protein